MTETTFSAPEVSVRMREELSGRFLCAATMASGFVLRLLLIFSYRFDSDEPQHLHVVWSWAHGLMQYRDTFDNHMPLFHLLLAPVAALTGDDPRLLYISRLAMIPLWMAAGWAIWKIAGELFAGPMAGWATALALLFPPFFLGSLEFRTDDLWVVLWLLLIAVVVCPGPLRRKAIQSGTLIGLAIAVSLKSALFVLAVLSAVMVTEVFIEHRNLRARLPTLALGFLPAALIPAAVGASFAAAGAWNSFSYGVLYHNLFPWEHSWHLIWALPFYYGMRAGAQRIRSGGPSGPIRKRVFVFLTGFSYIAILCTFWPMLSMESYLPFYPLLVLMAVPVLFRLSESLERRIGIDCQGLLIPLACAILQIGAIVWIAQPWRNEAREAVDLTREVLRLTSPAEEILDQKGEAVFRRRAFYLGFEAITNRKIRLGIIKDDVRQSLIVHRVHVVANAACLPRLVRHFIATNYVPVGRVHLSGQVLPSSQARAPVAVRMAVPGSYVIVGSVGLISASVDARPPALINQFVAGDHQIMLSEPCERPVLVWSGALRAYSPAQLTSMMDREFPPLSRNCRQCPGGRRRSWLKRAMRHL
jgi:hypothetical protein